MYNKMLFILLVTSLSVAGQTPNLTLATNNVTCLCENAAVVDADTFTINGKQKRFTKRTLAERNVLINTEQLFSYRRVCTKSKQTK
jgi:uncharacterized lipoprotein YajG